jgi:hypothetical protein
MPSHSTGTPAVLDSEERVNFQSRLLVSDYHKYPYILVFKGFGHNVSDDCPSVSRGGMESILQLSEESAMMLVDSAQIDWEDHTVEKN